MRTLGARLGLLGLDPEVFLRKRALKQAGGAEGAEAAVGPALTDADIERLIEERVVARTARNFKESDRIRDLLAANSIVLEDMPGGKTLWRRG
jgi:cysteinyl-tRNA synthetase